MSQAPLSDPIHVAKLRELDLSSSTQPGRPSFLTAASGLAVIGEHLYVVADDELSLGVFPRKGNAAGDLIRLLPGELPRKPKARKKAKPDFEVLVHVPAFDSCAHGALLAMGSGSKPNRCEGVLLPLASHGRIEGEPRIVDLSAFLAGIADHVGQVNIEGAFFATERFVLLQRGNKGDGVNAVIAFNATDILEQLARTSAIGQLTPLVTTRYDLGAVRGVPFGFTDGAALTGGAFVFSAIAEDTNDPLADGACVGAALGIADPEGAVIRLHPIYEPAKVEGVHASVTGDHIELLLVTDADDSTIPSRLLSASLDA